MGQITVFERNFLGSKFFFLIFSLRTLQWVITRCPMNFGGVFGPKNAEFETISEVWSQFCSQRADFAKIATLTLMQCMWGIFGEKYQVLYHFGILRSLPIRCHGARTPPVPYLPTVHSFVSSGKKWPAVFGSLYLFRRPDEIFFFFHFSLLIYPNIGN